MVLALTVTLQVSISPLFVVTVMSAEPVAIAVTFPSWSTVATDSSLLFYVKVLSVASAGVTLAVRDWLSPITISNVLLLRLTPVTSTFGFSGLHATAISAVTAISINDSFFIIW